MLAAVDLSHMMSIGFHFGAISVLQSGCLRVQQTKYRAKVINLASYIKPKRLIYVAIAAFFMLHAYCQVRRLRSIWRLTNEMNAIMPRIHMAMAIM